MPQLKRLQAVQDILKDLRGLDPLKRLFWSELNYDHVNQPLSRRGAQLGDKPVPRIVCSEALV